MSREEFFNKVKRRLIFTKRRWLRRISSDFFGPKEVRIYPIAYLCTNNCFMCWRSHNLASEERKKWLALEKQALKIAEYQAIFASLPPAVETIEVVGGGEPLLYPEIKRLTKLIKKNFYFGSLITNGVLLKPNLINHLLAINWDKIRVSIHASRPNIYKLVHAVDNFQIVWDNIRFFLDRRQKVQNKRIKSSLEVLFVTQKSNYQDVYRFAKLAQETGCDYVEFDTIYPYKKSMLLDKGEIEQVVAQLRKVADNLFVRNNVWEVINLYRFQPHAGENGVESKKYYQDKKCLIPSRSMIVDSFGNIHPCCFLDNSEPETVDCGSFRERGNLWSIWRQRKYKEVRRRLRLGKFYHTCLARCNYALDKKNNSYFA